MITKKQRVTLFLKFESAYNYTLCIIPMSIFWHFWGRKTEQRPKKWQGPGWLCANYGRQEVRPRALVGEGVVDEPALPAGVAMEPDQEILTSLPGLAENHFDLEPELARGQARDQEPLGRHANQCFLVEFSFRRKGSFEEGLIRQITPQRGLPVGRPVLPGLTDCLVRSSFVRTLLELWTSEHVV